MVFAELFWRIFSEMAWGSSTVGYTPKMARYRGNKEDVGDDDQRSLGAILRLFWGYSQTKPYGMISSGKREV